MAIYGVDFYGLAYYGATQYAQFAVDPFVAQPIGFNTITVSWNLPTQTWTELRLIRSRNGYAVDANPADGTILIDSASSYTTYTDTDLSGGCWYYYTLWFNTSSGWLRAGGISALSVKDTGMTDLLWDRIPAFFKYNRDSLAAITDTYYTSVDVWNPAVHERINQPLQEFMNVVGWGLDYVRNYHDTAFWSTDPTKTHLQNVDLLAQEFGMDYEYSLPSHYMRKKVANATTLAQQRGTAAGLKALCSLSTGWDVDVAVGTNLFLSNDQASFYNPQYPQWNSGVNYATGQQVEYEGVIYQAQTGAYGTAQAPPTPPTTSNTWWTSIENQSSSSGRDSTTNAIYTWQPFQAGTTKDTAYLAVGLSDSQDESVTNSNALLIKNSDSVNAHTYEVWGVANLTSVSTPTPTNLQVVKQGVPVPYPPTYNPSTQYYKSQYVNYCGRIYQANQDVMGQSPDTAPAAWTACGVSIVPRMALSCYAQGATAGVSVQTRCAFFDGQGNLISSWTAPVVQNMVYDGFNVGNWTSRSPAYNWSSGGSATWNVHSGNWEIWSDPSYQYRTAYPMSTGIATIQVPTTETHYRIAATFSRTPLNNYKQCIVLRYVDSNNNFRVTRTNVQQKVSGTTTTLATYATPVADGQRVMVDVNDSTNAWTVYVNGTQVASGTGFGVTATAPYQHGIGVIQ